MKKRKVEKSIAKLNLACKFIFCAWAALRCEHIFPEDLCAMFEAKSFEFLNTNLCVLVYDRECASLLIKFIPE